MTRVSAFKGLLVLVAFVIALASIGLQLRIAAAGASASSPASLLASKADSAGSPIGVDAAAAGSGSATPATSATDDYKDLKAEYDALKGVKDKSAKTLLYAAMLAGALKLLLDGVKLLSDRFNRGKKYIPWIATFAAVPIALLSHFAGGAGWFDSLVYAGAGPGAVALHELMGLFKKAPAVSPPPDDPKIS